MNPGDVSTHLLAHRLDLWRDIAVNHRHRGAVGGVAFVGCGQPAQGTDADESRKRPRHAFVPSPVVAKQGSEVEPIDPFRDQPVRALVVVHEIEHLRDVGMQKAGAQPSLLDEHRDLAILVAKLGLHLLERHRTRKPRGAVHDRTPNHRHAALARPFDELILAIDKLRPRLLASLHLHAL